MMTHKKPNSPWSPKSPGTIYLAVLFFYLLPLPTFGQISIPAVDVPYTQEFNILATSGTSSTMPTSWVFLETGAGSNGTYAADNGSTVTENTYSYGTGTATERALGQLSGATISVKMGVPFVNNTGTTLTSLLIQYTGEQWRLGALGRNDHLDFQYSTNATAIDNGAWTDFDGLDFTAPVTAGVVGPLDGNALANRTQLGNTITGLSIANGSTFWIRWNSFEATGNDDGLAIDEFAMTANPALHYTISNNGTALSIIDSDGNSDALDMSQVGTNIRFFAPGRTYSLNAGPTTPFPVDIAIAGLTSIVINAGTGNDTIDVGAFTTSLPLFTINGGIGDDVVNMNGDINFVANTPFNADLQNDAGTPGTDKFIVAAGANLISAGSGIATIRVSHSIVLNSGASIVTANGTLTVEANQQIVPTTGNFIGLTLNDALLQVTGIGIATIKGKGGTTGTNNHGIFISGGGDILGGTSVSSPVTITATGGASSNNANHGLSITGAGSTISSGGAHVNITGTGGGTSTSFANYGVHVISNATITSGGTGTVTINGTGGAATGGNNMGVWIGTSATINSGGGNVSVTGTGGGNGGTGTNNYGVHVQGGAKITGGGTATVTVMGTGGNAIGNANDGVSIWETNSIITSSGGNVNVTGQGGGSTTSGANVGVHLQTSGKIAAGGTGTVTVTGTGGATSGVNNYGIFVIENGTSISSTGGDVTLVGVGGGTGSSTNNYGVVVFQGLVSSGGVNDVTITGTGGASSGAGNYGVRISESTGMVTSGGGSVTINGIEGSGSDPLALVIHNSSSVTTAVNGGSILLTANSMNIASTVTTAAGGVMQIRPYSNDIDVNLGDATNPPGGPLNLSDAELDFVTCGTLYLGDIDAGTVTVSSGISRTALTHIGVYAGDGIVINGGNINSNGGNVLLDPGDSPDAIQAEQAGNDITCGTWIPVGDVLIDIDGTVADVSHTQVNIIGVVNLTNASLTLTGTHVPQPGEVFTILLNDGAEAITGTFSGLAQGATIPAFLGSNLPATISYTGGTGNDITLTVGAPDYIITNAGGILSVSDFAGNGETLTISQIGVNIRFDVLTRTYSLNGGAVTNFPADIALAGLTSITADVGTGNDVITFGTILTTMPSLTLNGGVGDETINFNFDITFNANASLNVDLQNDDPTPGVDQVAFGANVNLLLSGTGSAVIKVSRNLTMNSGSSLVTANGNLTVETNQQSTPSTGTFNGISILSNAFIQATGTGIVSVKGKGGTTSGNQNGININTGDIIGGTTGTTIIQGTGGISSGNTNTGITVSGAGASITTGGSNVSITGVGGGSGASLVNIGVNVGSGGLISAGGSGIVTVTGTGGASTGTGNEGIRVDGVGSTISSSGGNVSVNGSGGGSGGASIAYGIAINNSGLISAGGSGALTVNGVGGSGTGNNNYGVHLSASTSIIRGTSGTLTVLGQGGGLLTSSNNIGVRCLGTITSNSTGPVFVQGWGGLGTGATHYGVLVDGASAIITSGGGLVQVVGSGGLLSTSGNAYGVFVTAGAKIKSTGAGNTTILGSGGGAGSSSNNYGVHVLGGSEISAAGAGNVSVTGIGGLTTGNVNAGVVVSEVSSLVNSSGGSVTVTGSGGGTGVSQNNFGVYALNGGKITAGSNGTVTINGTGGASTGNFNYGVAVSINSATITSSGGNVVITGQGGGTGSSAVNIGVDVQQSGIISAGGTGNVTVNGSGGNTTGDSNYGVLVWFDGSVITSAGGDVTVLGEGGGDSGGGGSSAGFSPGVFIDEGKISAGGGGDVFVTGYGSPGTDFNNYGVHVKGNAGKITSSGGPVLVVGYEGGSATSYGINLTDNAEITTATSGGSIHMKANSMNVAGLVATSPLYYVWMDPLTNGVNINLGTAGDVNTGPLQLTDQELDSVSTGYLIIGNNTAGLLTTTADITRSTSTVMNLTCGDDISIDAGSVNTGGGDLTLVSGAAPDAVFPLRTASDVTCNTLYLIGQLEIDIDGLVADVSYTQMNVIGSVNLEDASLQLTGSHIPQAGQTFTIINNDGADAILNTFVGLAEGATITSFLGGAYPATISYVGGTGNDVVITVSSPHYLLSTTGNQIVFTDVAGNGETITMSQSGANSVQFAVPGRNYSLNGGAVTALPVVASLAGMTMVTVNAGAGNDGITVDDFIAIMPNLTLNGGTGNDLINMDGLITFAANANLDIDLQNDDPVPGEDRIQLLNGDLFLTGLGNATLKCSRNIVFNPLSSLTTVNGNLTLEANQQVTPTGGTFYGILLQQTALVEVTGTGILDVKGKGGNTGNAQIGVYLYNGSILRGGTVGNQVVTGYGGATSSNDNRGVQVQLNSAITTNGGNLIVNAQGGGTGASAHNHGIHLVQAGVITAGSMGTVTINSTGGLPTGIRNHGIHVYGAGSMVTSGGGDVFVYGQSGGTGTSSYNHGVFVEDNAVITAGGMGTVTVEGTGGGATGERNDGVICFRVGATITSGGGDVHVTGVGGGTSTSAYNYGVFLDFGGVITAGGMGDLYVNGTGGATTGTRNAGVFVYLENSYITTSGGDLHITGQGGGAGASIENFGVYVLNGATVTAGGTGNVFIDGTGGNTTGTRNDGVLVEGDTAIITSSGGNVEVIGQGSGNGVAFRNYGVFANNTGVITAGGTGNVHVEGTGAGAAEGVRNYGVVVAVAGSMITSSGGAITVIGQGGGTGPASNNNFGTYLTSGSIIAPGDATISVDGNGGNASGPYNFGVLSIGTSSIQTANGNINIIGHGGGVAGSTDNNGVRIDAVVMAGGSGHVNVEGYGGTTTGINNYGFVMEGGIAEITTDAGNITVFGQGFGSGGLELGVYMGGGAQIISGGAGTTTVEGIGAENAGATNYGVYMQTSGTLISSSGGDVSVTGQGGGALGNGSNNYGIDIVAGAEISAGGDGNVTLHGTGGASTGSNNYGVVIYNSAATVSSSGGDIHIMAQGGGTGAGGSNIGFHLQSQGMIAAGGTGDILVEGNGGDALGNGNHGALIYVNGTSVTTVDGDIAIIGAAGGIGNSNSNIGIEVNNGMIQAGGDGVISLQGSGALTTGELNNGITIIGSQGLVATSNGDISLIGVPGSNTNAYGILHSSGAQMHTITGGGNIWLLANSMHIQSGITTLAADTVFISSLSIDTSIQLGSIDDPINGPLSLSDAELDSITTGTLMIGAMEAGTITVVDTITRTLLTVVNLTSGSDVIFDGGMLHTLGGNSRLDPGVSPAGVKPLQYGTDISCGTLTFGSDLIINIDGTIPDTTYDQLNANGVVNLTGVSLVLTGTHMPVFSDTFTIVVNDGVDPIVGTFSGLPQGGSIPSFLGSNLTATISYTGGDGNDVELYMITPDYLITNAGGHLVVTDLSGNADAMTISENGANIRFAVPGRTYSYNLSAIANLPADVMLAGLDSITVNGEEGNDNFTINSFMEDFPAFTLNGGTGNESVTFAGDITFQPDAGLNVDLQNDDVSPGTDNITVNANVDLLFAGTGALTYKSSRDILFNTGSNIQLEDGNVIIEANYQLVPTALNFHGVTFQNSTLTVSGTGSMLIKGKAGQTNIANHGVRLESGSDIIGGTSDDIYIEGIGAQSVGAACFGVLVNGAGTLITSNGADVHVTGLGGGVNASNGSNGVEVTTGAIITAGGMGNVFVTGTGGNGSGTNNAGVRVYAPGSAITSSGGNITVVGTGSPNSLSSQGYGVAVIFAGKIAATGNGVVNVTGTGGQGNDDANDGVVISGTNSMITSVDGDVIVNGYGGSGGGAVNLGVDIGNNGIITSSGLGDVFVTGMGGLTDGGTNYGINLSQFGTISSAGGHVTVTGMGGGTGNASLNPGVAVGGDGLITAGGMGNVLVTGTGGNTTGNNNHGVRVRVAGATITSSGGNVTVIGNASGNGASAANVGVFVELAGKITAGNNGQVSVTGTGALTQGLNNQGVRVDGVNSLITSTNGNVMVTGTGGGSGSGSGQVGVFVVNSGLITAGGTGNVIVDGVAGQSTGLNNTGVALENSGDITSANGNINVTGTGSVTPTGSTHFGVRLLSNSMIVAGGAGIVSVQGTGGAGTGNGNNGVEVNGAGAIISSTGGNVTINGQGGGTGTAQLNIGVQAQAGGVISAGGAGNVVITGNGGNPTGNSNFGVAVRGTNTMVTSSGGNIQITGVGGGTGASQIGYGVTADSGGKIQAGGNGNVVINGTGGMNVSSSAFGIAVSGPVTTITSSGGNVTLNGTGGGVATAANSTGVSVLNGGIISAGNTGNVVVAGQGGIVSGNNSNGVTLQSAGTMITSAGGNVTVTGIGGGVGAAQICRGVFLSTGPKISAGGAGNVNVTGTGGSGSLSNHTGVYLEGNNTAITSGGGNITVTGIEGSSSLGFVVTNNADISTAAMGGNVTCISNSIGISAAITTNASGTVLVKPYSNGRKIELNNAVDANGSPLRLSDTELDSVFTNNLVIGSAVADTITIGTAITRIPTTQMELITAGDIIFSGGIINTNSGDLILEPGITPRAIEPTTSGVDATVDTVTFEGDLKVRINGTTVDVQYQQFRVNGSIDLNSVGLALLGTHTPMEGDSFVIVNNDDVDAIIGTFDGLAEGDTIFNFLGSPLNAVITYTGNTGNDVVLRIPVTCLFPDVPVIAAVPDTVCEGTQVTLNIVSGNLGAATEWHWYSGSCGGISVGTGNSIMVTPGMTTTYYARGEGGCVTAADCGDITVVVNAFPDAAIDRDAPGPCYYTENVFQPEAAEIPGATYQWNFGAGAQPMTAMGYGPHNIIYTTSGSKTVKLVIYPNAPGAQCPDSSTIMFVINNCPGQILGSVIATNGAPINNVNVKLFADANADGIPDTTVHIRSIFTPANGQYAMATLLPGSYVLVETQPNLWLSYDDGDSTPDGDLVANTDSLDNVIPVTLIPSEVDSFNIFVERPEPGTITGTVFQDFDLDQVPDPGEGIAGVLISIYADANTNGVADNSTAIDTAHTNSMGNYAMADVQVGHYVIVESQPPGMNSIKDFDPSPDGDVVPNTNMNNDTLPVSLVNAEMDNHNYFIDVLSGCALVVTNNNDAGPGTFRDALACAMPGDTVRFHAALDGDTIEITSGTIVIEDDVIVKSDVLIAIRSSVNDLIAITPGVEVQLRNVHLVSGLSPSGAGAAIDNHGQLLLHNTHIKPNPLLPPGEYLVRNYPGAHIEFSGNNFVEE